ncbi:MAG: GspE/PulE family protein [Candidatus Wildermuthbacteria bacterium]|nr:GspE/PulE family protein [Candidatus Wildermuthbacteria bacterium]
MTQEATPRNITGEVRISSSLLKELREEAETLKKLREYFTKLEGQETSVLLAALLGGASGIDASDVHLEPRKEDALLRLRIDGLLQEAFPVSLPIYKNLLSRIKLCSGLKLNIEDRPQDGRFTLFWEDQPIEIRTATLPSEHGESLVLRILNPKRIFALEELGLREDLKDIIRKEIQKPNGMVIVTGPTGSGKTTTLYAFLREVTKPELKVITIEDPIEYHLSGVSQTQVDSQKGYDFASGLRAIVRQDPDIVLVGEIRDGETADIALQAALTGHLVFSTLHTNDAVGTISRLTSLDAKIETIASALSLVIAQRLLRKVCSKCVELTQASAKELETIEKAISSLQGAFKTKVIKTLKLPRPKGCEQCNFTGYKGRVGIFEAFLIDPATEEFVLASPSTSALKAFAVKKGMVDMYQDGILKVLKNITTLEELERVAIEE